MGRLGRLDTVVSARDPELAVANRLANETSPYLKQHEGKPVDRFPWGSDTFEEARRRDVPLFLSVGYCSCPWCHPIARG